MVKKVKKDTLNGMYQLLAESYKGNWQYRWADTPYLEHAMREGKVESVAGHVWGAMEFWFYLRRLCPELDSLVNTIEIYEILLNHDLGETNAGDVPLYKKVHGTLDNKEAERMDLKQITDSMPKIQPKLLAWFDEFEQKIEKINKLEILIAKWIDNLQGNHYGLTFGKNFREHSTAINKILQIRFVAYTNRILEVLAEQNKLDAIAEVKQVALHHADFIKAIGIEFDTSKLYI